MIFLKSIIQTPWVAFTIVATSFGLPRLMRLRATISIPAWCLFYGVLRNNRFPTEVGVRPPITKPFEYAASNNSTQSGPPARKPARHVSAKDCKLVVANRAIQKHLYVGTRAYRYGAAQDIRTFTSTFPDTYSTQRERDRSDRLKELPSLGKPAP
jgi:hypothetical protein